MRLTLAFSTVLFVGCASQPTLPPVSGQVAPPKVAIEHQAKLQQIQAFTLKGRLGVITQQQGFSGSIDWQHQPQTDDIQVYSPLGGKVASIAKTPVQVTLTDHTGNTISAADAESLTEQTLGFRLPLNGLSDWALGRPSNSPITANSWDANGRLIMLEQAGWRIDYASYSDQNGVSLPQKMVLKNDKVTLKLLTETWSTQDMHLIKGLEK